MPLLFRLTVALALSFVLELSAFSWEYETEKMKKSIIKNDALILKSDWSEICNKENK